MEMARIGATPASGSNRLTLTDADKAARDLFLAWAYDNSHQFEMIGNSRSIALH